MGTMRRRACCRSNIFGTLVKNIFTHLFSGEADQPRHPDRVRGHGRVSRHRPNPLHQVLRGQVPLRGEDPEHDDDDDDTTLKFDFEDQSSVRGNCVLKYTQ